MEGTISRNFINFLLKYRLIIFVITSQVRDDWNDLIEYVAQRFSPNLLLSGGGQVEQVADMDDEVGLPTIIATPATPAFGLESLKRQLVNSGSFYFYL